ncbi:MAG: HAD family hydrolase, partial [Gemmatimonadota bacterium]|nr:HAD family hydrolase [Gemmatimonadota bacterium]
SDATFQDRCFGRSTPDAVRAALDAAGVTRDDVGIELLTARAEREFASGLASGAALMPGATDLIAAAQGRVRLALVTRAARHAVDPLLALAGIDGAFECVVTSDDTLDAKPNPAPYRRAIERLSRRRAVVLSRALALEDGLAGIRSARAAGVRCIAVATAPFVALEADACVDSLAGQTIDSLRDLLDVTRVRVR